MKARRISSALLVAVTLPAISVVPATPAHAVASECAPVDVLGALAGTICPTRGSVPLDVDIALDATSATVVLPFVAPESIRAAWDDGTYYEGLSITDVDPANGTAVISADSALIEHTYTGRGDYELTIEGLFDGSWITIADLATVFVYGVGCWEQPAAVPPTGISNIGFETGDLTDWSLGELTVEGICVVGADAFTEPYDGDFMARIGFARTDVDDQQYEGPNVMFQDFVVDEPTEAFAYNMFTYDNAGFDEFRYTVTDPATGAVLVDVVETAWGSGDELKTSGWREVVLDLGDRLGDTLRLTIQAGGTDGEVFPTWVYVDTTAARSPLVFGAFVQPVDGGDAWNAVNAGSTVPLRWRVTDVHGAPVTDLTRIDVEVATVPCAGDTSVAGELQHSRAEGRTPRHLGRGSYLYLWATPASAAGSCATVTISAPGGGSTSANFAFTS